MEVYFDNSATTRALDEVGSLVLKMMTEEYGNPSARHIMGMRAEQAVKEAAEIIAQTDRKMQNIKNKIDQFQDIAQDDRKEKAEWMR